MAELKTSLSLSSTSTTAAIYTADILSQWTVTSSVDAGWNAITMPTAVNTFINGYTDATAANELAAYIDIMGFDLTQFITDCTTSNYCDHELYNDRYDGLAIVNYFSFTF